MKTMKVTSMTNGLIRLSGAGEPVDIKEGSSHTFKDMKAADVYINSINVMKASGKLFVEIIEEGKEEAKAPVKPAPVKKPEAKVEVKAEVKVDAPAEDVDAKKTQMEVLIKQIKSMQVEYKKASIERKKEIKKLVAEKKKDLSVLRK